MTGSARTILLVEDEDSIALPLAAALEREGYATRITGSAPEAIALAAELQPDLILLDVMLSDGSGLDVCREVRRESKVPIIMLTARGDETDRVVGLELGADDYVVKPFSARELVARIRAVLRRVPDETAEPPAGGAEPGGREYRVDGLVVDTAMRRVVLDGEEVSLTRREFDLLALLMRNAGTVLTREHLIDEVWDTNWFGSTKTLDVHVSSLRRKLGDDAVDSRYLHTVRGVGFRFAAPDRSPDDVSRPSAGGLRLRAGARDRGPGGAAALSTERRIDREVRAQAADGAQLAAASASGRLPKTGELDALAREVDRELGARVIVVGRTGSLISDSQQPGVRGVAYGNRPEIAAALAGRTVQGRRRSDTLDRSCSTPPCRSSRPGAPWVRCG